jgi:hypothetical protein
MAALSYDSCQTFARLVDWAKILSPNTHTSFETNRIRALYVVMQNSLVRASEKKQMINSGDIGPHGSVTLSAPILHRLAAHF